MGRHHICHMLSEEEYANSHRVFCSKHVRLSRTCCKNTQTHRDWLSNYISALRSDGDVIVYRHWNYLPWSIPISFHFILHQNTASQVLHCAGIPICFFLLYPTFLITEQARSFYKNLFIFLLKALSSFSFGSHLSFVQMKPVHSGKYRLSLLQK